eukprot:1310477-Amphidinium_carterae.2
MSERALALAPHASADLPEFDWKAPTLASCQLPDAQHAKLLQRLAISEGMIPTIWLGQQGLADL